MFQPIGSHRGVSCCNSPSDLVRPAPPHCGFHFLLSRAELGDLVDVQDEQEPTSRSLVFGSADTGT